MKVTQRLQSHPTDPSQKDWKVHSIPKSDLCDKECDARKIHEEDRGRCPLVVLRSVWRFFDNMKFVFLFFTLTRQTDRQCWCRMPNPNLILEAINWISILVSIMISISLKNQPLSTWTTTMKSMIMLAMVPVELSISFFSNFPDLDFGCNFYYPDFSKPIDIVARNFRRYATELCQKFPARIFDAAFVMSKCQLAHLWGRDNFLDSHRNRSIRHGICQKFYTPRFSG